jgi:hypothetical protein
VRTSPTSNPTQRITVDQAQGREEYHSNRQPDSGVLLPTMIWDTSPNQLSHFLSCILSRVNISIYFQLVNVLL